MMELKKWDTAYVPFENKKAGISQSELLRKIPANFSASIDNFLKTSSKQKNTLLKISLENSKGCCQRQSNWF